MGQNDEEEAIEVKNIYSMLKTSNYETNEEEVLASLKDGVPFSDNDGNSGIEYLTLDMLTEYFDSFISSKTGKKSIAIDYRSLSQNLKIFSIGQVKMKEILRLADHASRKDLLNHPVISVILMLEWKKDCEKLYFINLVSYLIHFMFQVTYIFSHNLLLNYCLLGYMFPYLLITFIFELIQFWLHKKKYIMQLENYLEFILLLFSCLTIYYKQYEKHRITAFPNGYTLTLLCLELFFLLGQHPVLSRFITIYKKVLSNFMLHIGPYSILMIGFAFSFYSQNLNNNYVEEHNIQNITHSFFNTFIMFVGEFNTSEISFELFPMSYQLIYIIFVLCIPIALTNLLIGLAVSDMQKIESDAQILENKERALAIDNMEKSKKIKFFKIIYQSFAKKNQGYVTKIKVNYKKKWIFSSFKVKYSNNRKEKELIFIKKNLWVRLNEIAAENKIPDKTETINRQIKHIKHSVRELRQTMTENFEKILEKLNQR